MLMHEGSEEYITVCKVGLGFMDVGSEDSASLKRSRTHIACEVCRKRKIRCDSLKPTCSNCIRSKADCVYPEDGRRKRNRQTSTASSAASKDSPEQVTERLQRVEQLLEALVEAQTKNGGAKRRATSSNTSASLSDYELSDSQNTPRSTVNTPETPSSNANGGSETANLRNHVKDNPQDDQPQEEGQANYRHSGNHQTDRSSREDMDLLHLSDRRSPVIIKLGDDEPLVTYTHGFTTQLLNPTLMRNLCEKIGCVKLGRAAENKLTALWRYKMCQILNEYVEIDVDATVLDPRLIAAGMKVHKQSSSFFVGVLCDDRDVEQVRRMCCPSGNLNQIDFNNPYSLLYLIMAMQASDPSANNSGQFTREYIAEQNSLAFKLCLRLFVPNAHSTFLLLRLQLFAIYVLYRRMYFPQLRALIAMSLSMAYDLGLHRLDGSRQLTPEERHRRVVVWVCLRDLDVKLSCTIGIVTLSSGDDWPLNEIFCGELKNHPEVRGLIAAAQLDLIYIDLFENLFSERAQRHSVKELMHKLCRIVDRLNTWWDEVPSVAKEMMKRIEIDDNKITSRYSKTQEYYDHPYDTPPGGSDAQKSDTNSEKNGATSISSLISPSPHSDSHFKQEFAPTWNGNSEGMVHRIYASTLLCYYHILQLVHSIPAFSPSCLKVYKQIPPTLRDSLNIVNHCSIQILRLSFNKEGLQSLGYLPISATNAFSAMFLKQIRAPHHPTNGTDIELIYQYIHRFHDIQHRDMVRQCSSSSAGLVYELWCTFASILTQLKNMRRAKEEQQQRLQRLQQQPPLGNMQEGIPPDTAFNLRSPPPVQPIYNPNAPEMMQHQMDPRVAPSHGISSTVQQMPEQVGGAPPQAEDYMAQSTPYIPPNMYQDTFDASPDYSQWDAFNDYNGIEVNVPPQNAPQTGGTEVDRALNNCTIC